MEDPTLTADDLDFTFRDPVHEALALTTAVGEPASALLLDAGLPGLALRR